MEDLDINSVFNTSETLKATDLGDREFTLVIASVTRKEFDDGDKLLITFQGAKKAMVCNKTNSERIAYLYGTNAKFWIGKEITIYNDPFVEYQGKRTGGLRIKPPPSRQPQPAPAPKSDDLNDSIPF